MKKSLLILACAAATLSATAQLTVVKDAEKAMKSGKDYTTVYSMIQPAMSNAETSSDATTYFIPGKAGFNQYDKMLGQRQLGVLPAGEEVVMATALIGGYDNFMKALPLDSVVDAKGKVKTKHSKEIKNIIAGHYNDFSNAGVDFYNAKKYDDAINAWEIYVNLTENAPMFGLDPKMLANDTIVASIYRNAGIAAWQNNNNAVAAKKFRRAIEKGYDKEDVFQYGIATALAGNDAEDLYFFSSVGNDRFGDSDPQYINSLINYYLKGEKYDDAIKYLDDAIAKKPGYSQYYALEGIIYESKEDMPKAMSLYEKAVQIDPNNGLANYYYGRGLSIEAGKLADEFNGDGAAYQAYYAKELKPRYEKAINVLENAYKLDENNRSNTLNMLEQLYYVTNNEAGMDSVKERKLAD